MTVTTYSTNRVLERPAPSSLEDIVDTILDHGMVVDVAAQVSLLGVEVLFIDARIVMASIDSYLRFAVECTPALTSARSRGRDGQRSSVPRRAATV